jgi:hypothetical protein
MRPNWQTIPEAETLSIYLSWTGFKVQGVSADHILTDRGGVALMGDGSYLVASDGGFEANRVNTYSEVQDALLMLPPVVPGEQGEADDRDPEYRDAA